MTTDDSAVDTSSTPVAAAVASLGRLERIDAREVWKHEARDFTPWLLEHAEALADALGVDIELHEREVGVGDFNVDLVGRIVGTDHVVIVENQLAATDHSHLGQLLTYAAGLDAAYIVWVTPQFRDEHRRALDWLNEVTREGISFFGVELELLRIVDATENHSVPAPHFKLAAQPNDWQKVARTIGEVGGSASGGTVPSARGLAYQSFFTDLLQRVRHRQDNVTNARRVSYESWFNFPSGRSGIIYSVNFAAGGRFKVELYLGNDRESNKVLFDSLLGERQKIERSIGQSLAWERLENRIGSRIALYHDGSILDPPGQLDQLKDWAVTYLFRFRDTFTPLLQILPSPEASSQASVSTSGQPHDEDDPSVTS